MAVTTDMKSLPWKSRTAKNSELARIAYEKDFRIARYHACGLNKQTADFKTFKRHNSLAWVTVDWREVKTHAKARQDMADMHVAYYETGPTDWRHFCSD